MNHPQDERVVPTFGVLIAQSTFTHIGKLYGALRAGIHKPIAALRMKLRSGDNLSQLFHICRLDVHYIKALILDVEVPEVDP